MSNDSDFLDTKFHYCNHDGSFAVERIQDVEPIIEANKRSYNESSASWKGTFHHVASVPLVIIEKYKNEKGIDLLQDKAALKAFLNDPENRFMRTKPGRI